MKLGNGKVVLFSAPEDVLMPMPVRWEPPEFSPLDFVFAQRFGGMMIRPDPALRIIVTEPPPVPTAPGVEAMLADGWAWTGWRFARDQCPRKVWTEVTTVRVEEDAWKFHDPVFVRTGPEGDPRIGQFRCDDASGDAVKVDGMLWKSVLFRGQPDPAVGHSASIGRRTTRLPGRYAGYVSGGRVLAGRYAERLPTNRKRKRERAKARRRGEA